MSKLVYNIEPASPSMISSLDRHCLTRVPDGASNIDPDRSHLNQLLIGERLPDPQGPLREGQAWPKKAGPIKASMDALYDSGVKKPAAQSERPYLRIVLSASPEYFRPDDPDAVGTWDEDRLAAWIEATMAQLRGEHGDDLIFAELHLDEDTPHIHAVVAPTYLKKARTPGRQKRGETPEQFEARKAAALASEGVRTVGRASHPTLSKPGSFQRLRERMAVAVDPLGIEYGEDRAVDAPEGKSTRQWVKEQAAELREKHSDLEEQARQKARELVLEIRDAQKTVKSAEADAQKAAEDRVREEVRTQEAKAEADRLETQNRQLREEGERVAKAAAVERAALEAARREIEALEPQRVKLQAEIAQEQTALAALKAQAASILENAKAEAAADLATTMEWVERGVGNLGSAIERVKAGTHDVEIRAEEMPDRPKAFDVLKRAAPDNRPTWGFRARFWSLNFSDTGLPAPLPEQVRKVLTNAFDRVASWAVELRNLRREAQSRLSEADEAFGTASQRGYSDGVKAAKAAITPTALQESWQAGWYDLRTSMGEILTKDAYNKVFDHFEPLWAKNPKNVEKPPPAPAPKPEPSDNSSGPSFGM